jgi:hypothetical protein
MSVQLSPLPESSISLLRPSGPDLPCPIIRRESIHWTGGANRTPIRIQLDFENPEHRPSRMVSAHVEVASFGAFLTWKPLTTVQVPPVPPWGRVRIATAGGDKALPTLASLTIPSLARGLFRTGTLKSFPDFFSRGSSPHFVGNLNVYVTRTQLVERHVGHAVGLRPGCQNLACFMVGDGRRDRYTFTIGQSDPGWDLRLQGVEWDTPVEIESAMILLGIEPPRRAQSGHVSVLVHRGSTGQKVPVEFCLETHAAGAKCYSFPG